MKILNALVSGFLALGLAGWLPMMGIFAGGAGAQDGQVALGNTVMWMGILFGLSGFVLNIWGQIKYFKLAEDASTKKPLLMMYSSVIMTVFFFLFAWIFVFES